MKKNKFLACFVALATLISGFTAFAEDTEESTASILPIVETFDEATVNENGTVVLGDDWYVISYRNGYAASTVTPNTDGKQIDVAYSAAPPSNYGAQSTVFKRQNLSVKERVVIEANVKPRVVGSSNGAYVALLQLTDVAGGDPYTPLTARGGTFTVTGGTNTTYSANKWYNLKMVLEYDETESKFTTYDLYINDVLYADDVALTGITEISAVALINCTPFNATSYSFDNFSIKGLADGENPIKPLSIVHDFNKISTDEDGAPIFDSNWKITNGEGYATSTISTRGTDSQIDVAYSTVPSSKWGGVDRTKFVRQNLSIKERVVIEEKVRPNTVSGSSPSAGAHVQLLQLTAVGGTTTISPLYARGGTFTVTGGTNTKYAANRWYNLKMVLDYDKTTSKFTSYDLYINDVLYANDVALTDVTEITEVALVNCTPYAKTSYSFDDLSIKAIEDGEFKQYYLYNDYEDEKITGDNRGYISLGAGTNTIAVNEEADGNRHLRFTSVAENGTSMTVSGGHATNYPLNAPIPCTFQYRFKLSSTYGNLYPVRVIRLSDGTEIAHGDKVTRTSYPAAWDWTKWNELKITVFDDKIEYYVNDVLYKTFTPTEGTSYEGLSVTQVELFNENYVPVNSTIDIDDIAAYSYVENTDYYSDNYDDRACQDFLETGVITASSYAKPYSLAMYSQYDSLKVVPLDKFGNNALQFTTQYDPSVGYKDVTLQVPLNDVSGKVAFEQKIKVSRGDTRAVMFRLFDGNNTNFDTVTLQNYKLKAGGTEIADILNDTWYTIKVVLNTSANSSQSDTYSVFLNGEEVATDLPLKNGNAGPATALKKFIPVSYQEINYKSVLLLDDLRVYEIPLDPSEITLDVNLTVTDVVGDINPNILYTGERVTIKADVINGTDSALTPILFVAYYDTNNNLKILHSDKAENALAIGEDETLELEITPPTGEDLIMKAFVWEGTDTQRPSEIAVYNVSDSVEEEQ